MNVVFYTTHFMVMIFMNMHNTYIFKLIFTYSYKAEKI